MKSKPKYVRIGGEDYLVDDSFSPVYDNLSDAWKVEGKVVTVDMDKARDMWRDEIRYYRNYEWAEVDSRFMKALETGADTTEIVAEKQRLRDMTSDPRIDAATTPEELCNIRPTQRMKDALKEVFEE